MKKIFLMLLVSTSAIFTSSANADTSCEMSYMGFNGDGVTPLNIGFYHVYPSLNECLNASIEWAKGIPLNVPNRDVTVRASELNASGLSIVIKHNN